MQICHQGKGGGKSWWTQRWTEVDIVAGPCRRFKSEICHIAKKKYQGNNLASSVKALSSESLLK